MTHEAQYARPSDQSTDDDTKLDDGSYGQMPPVLSLQLDVRDPVVIEALCSMPEGRARSDFALDSLRIGVLALKHASSRIDTEQVQNAGEQLIGKLQQALEQHADSAQKQTATLLKDYFDPKSGRLSERVERLVSADGELAGLLKSQLHGEASPLAQLFGAQFGQESPLMKQLDPEQSGGLLARLQKTVEQQLTNQRDHVLRQFSLDDEQSALSRLVRELTGKHGDLSKDLQGKIDEVIKEFSLDKEDSALSRLVANVDRAQKTISSEFSLDNRESGLSRVKEELLGVLSAHVKTNAEFQEKVTTELAKLTQKRESATTSTEHGDIFEEAVVAFLQNESQQRGDLCEGTGNTTGSIRNCKVGDAIVRLGPDSSAAGATIVFEAKEALNYSVPKAIDELEQAKKNRSADFGVFIWSRATAPEGIKPIVRYRNDLIVVWDAQDPSTDSYLLAAIEIARACVTEFHRGSETEEIDFDAIDKAINTIEKHAENLEQISKWTGTIHSSSEKILERVRKDQEGFERQIVKLREKLGALRTNGLSV